MFVFWLKSMSLFVRLWINQICILLIKSIFHPTQDLHQPKVSYVYIIVIETTLCVMCWCNVCVLFVCPWTKAVCCTNLCSLLLKAFIFKQCHMYSSMCYGRNTFCTRSSDILHVFENPDLRKIIQSLMKSQTLFFRWIKLPSWRHDSSTPLYWTYPIYACLIRRWVIASVGTYCVSHPHRGLYSRAWHYHRQKKFRGSQQWVTIYNIVSRLSLFYSPSFCYNNNFLAFFPLIVCDNLDKFHFGTVILLFARAPQNDKNGLVKINFDAVYIDF